jgi:hypothetical protein
VKNTNKTAKNGYATKKKLDDVIEEKIDASYVWGK